MNVCYASDNNYISIMGTSIISLLENNKNCDYVNIYILDDDIHNDNKKRLLQIAEKYPNCTIYFCNIKSHVEYLADNGAIPWRNTWRLTTWARIFMEDLIPKNVDRILYLDSDIIVTQNLLDLYNTNLDKKVIACVQDCVSIAHKQSLGIQREDVYFNAGVLLINMNNWRTAHVGKILIEDFLSGGFAYKLADQDLLNKNLKNDKCIISLKYNYQSWFRAFSIAQIEKYMGQGSVDYFSEKDINDAKNDYSIIHFNMSLIIRPWFRNSNDPLKHEFLKYRDLSPWRNEKLAKFKYEGGAGRKILIYRCLPRIWAIKLIRVYDFITAKLKKVKMVEINGF